MNTQQLLQESERSRLALLSILEDQKRTEGNLRKSESYNRLLFNLSPIGLVLCKIDGSMVDLNPAYANILGRTIEEALKLSYWDITPKKYEEQEKQQLKSLDETGRYRPYEKEYIHKDGHLVPVRLQGLIFEQEGERFIWSSVEDISDRKKAEEAQRESEARYRKLVETEPECVKVLTKDNILQDMNPAGLAMIEADSREQVVGKSIMGIIDPEYRAAFNDLVRRVFLGESGILEFKITGLKGTMRWVETHAVHMRDEQGKIHSLLSITRDITERKRAEEALKESESRFRRLAENAQDMIYRMSLPDGKYEYVSPAALTLFGYTPEEFYNTPVLIQKTIHPDWHKYFEDQWANLIKGEMSPTYEYQIIHKSGEVRWLNQRNILVRGDAGNPIAIEGIVTDITERKRMEEVIIAKEQFISGVTETTPAIIYVYNMVSNSNVYINNGMERLLGYSQKEIHELGENVLGNLVHPDDIPSVIELHSKFQTASDEDTLSVEYRMKHRDGNWIFLHSDERVFLRGRDGLVLQKIGVAVDITERKQAEENLRLSENKFSNAFHLGPAGMTITRIADGKFIDVNNSFLMMFEFTREEVIGHTSTEINMLNSEERGKLIKMQLESGGLRDCELLSRSKSGRIINLLFSSKPMQLKGEPCHITTMIDITERKRAEESLRESERKISNLISNLPGMAYRCNNDKDWTMLYISGGCYKITGYPPDDLIGNKKVAFNELILEQYRTYLWEKWQKRLSEKLPFEDEYQIYTANGETKWVWERGRGVLNENGELLFLEGYIEDITQRKLAEQASKRAEETLRESEEKYRSIFDNVRDCIYTISAEGILMTINPEFEPLTGWSVKEWLGKSFTGIVHPDDLSKAITAFKKILSGEKVEAYELRILTKSGEYRIGEFTPSPSKSGDKIVGALGIARDITQRKLAEQASKRTEEEILQHAKQLATLLTASQALAATLDLTTILQTITESAAEIMQFGTTAIYLLEGENLYLGATTPPLPLQFPETFRHTSLADHPHIHEAVTTGLPVIIPDAAIAQLTKAERAISDARGLRTILYVPLIVGEKTVGTLILGTVGATRNFTESQIDLFRTLSNQAAIAIENARLLNEIRQRNKEMNILDSIIKSTTTRLELQSILDKALEGAIAITGLEGGTLCLVDNEKKVLDLSAAHNTSKEMFDELSAQSIGIGDCLCGKAAQTGEPLILWDNASGSEYATHESVRNEAIRFHAAFPLIAGGKTLGVLCIFAKNEFKPTKQSLEMLNELCGTVALAIENAKLYQEVQQHVEKLVNNITELTDAKDQLGKSNSQLRKLSTRLQTIREEERTSIAREIHDELGQMLTGLKYELMWIEKRIGPDRKEMQQKVKDTQELIDSIIKTVRKISAELRPGILDLGLVAAIEWQTKEFRRRTGITGLTAIDDVSVQISENTSTQVFRIFQEILTNIMRHANASNVDIVLKPIKNNLILTVSDNGKGLQPDTKPDEQSLGLLGMQERTIIFGGSLSIKSAANKGTTIEVSIPFEHSIQ